MAAQQAVAEGGEIITGGHRRLDVGPQFVEPTIIRMPTQTDIVRHETFAPILYLIGYQTLADAIAFHNDVPQGLSSAIFTDSLRTGPRLAARLAARRKQAVGASRVLTVGART
jgi:aldehyde dehydrogenase (NAD+)